jgi:hypothetical protein
MVKGMDPEVQERVKTMYALPADIEILADSGVVARKPAKCHHGCPKPAP